MENFIFLCSVWNDGEGEKAEEGWGRGNRSSSLFLEKVLQGTLLKKILQYVVLPPKTLLEIHVKPIVTSSQQIKPSGFLY